MSAAALGPRKLGAAFLAQYLGCRKGEIDIREFVISGGIAHGYFVEARCGDSDADAGEPATHSSDLPAVEWLIPHA